MWALGGSETDTGFPGKGMEVDAAGNVYTAGLFSGTIDADPGPGMFNVTSAGGQDILVSKLDSAGHFVWAAAMGGPGSDQGRSIALDGQGNLYTAGIFQQTVDFDPGAGASNLTSALDANGNSTADVFALKLNANDLPPPPPAPALAINDVTVAEGNAGTASATFTVSLSAASTETVVVSFATANGTAAAGSDYVAASGTLTFAPGETSQTVTVQVNGDRVGEPDEVFFINLGNAANATIADGLGTGTIVRRRAADQHQRRVEKEGKKNQTTLFTFTVTLSAAYDQPVTMSYRTVNGTATTATATTSPRPAR